MGLLVEIVVYGLAPSAVCVLGIATCIRRLHRSGIRFNYSSTEALAASLSLVPTAVIAAIVVLNAGSDLPGLGMAMGTAMTALLAQLFAFVRVRTGRLLEEQNRWIAGTRIPTAMLGAVLALLIYWLVVLLAILCCVGVA